MDAINKNILLAGEVVAKKWRIAEKIGEGTFSQIYSAFCLDSDDKVAIKVEAPSALKPVLEWESTILKSLQKCPYVCRYYYHGKHAESTVLVMELLGESMSMLRVSPESIYGVPVSKCVAVGLEMLDAIEAFHKHGYVHRDIKASNFALSVVAAKPGSASATRRRYLMIDFGLSRQHLAEGNVIPGRPVAEFRGTSMYASLSAHRRQELGPKDDLWSWFYLVLDFMRGELPWATDAQQKNRQTVFSLKEYYTEKHPGLLVEGLPGGSHLLAITKYLQGVKYEDSPDYALLRDRLRRVAAGTEGEDTIELWEALSSDRERALQWTIRANDALQKKAELTVLETLQSVAKKYNTFFDCEELNEDEQMAVQEAVFELETKIKESAQKFAPPPIQSFKRRQESEQKIRTDALRKRRERDLQIRHSIEQRLRRQSSVGATGESPANDVGSGSATPTKLVEKVVVATHNPVHKSEDSSMDMSDGEDPGNSNSNGNGNKNGQPPRTAHVQAHAPPPASSMMPPRGPPPPPPGGFARGPPPHMGGGAMGGPPPGGFIHPPIGPPLGRMPQFRPPPPPPHPPRPPMMLPPHASPRSAAAPSPRPVPERPSPLNGDGYNRTHDRRHSRSRTPDRSSHNHSHSHSHSHSRHGRRRSRSPSRSHRSRSRSRSASRSRSRSRHSSSRSRRHSRGRSRSRSHSTSPSRSRSHYDDKYRGSSRKSDPYHRSSSPRDDDRGRYGGSRYGR